MLVSTLRKGVATQCYESLQVNLILLLYPPRFPPLKTPLPFFLILFMYYIFAFVSRAC
jgi:hypothetical protein